MWSNHVFHGACQWEEVRNIVGELFSSLTFGEVSSFGLPMDVHAHRVALGPPLDDASAPVGTTAVGAEPGLVPLPSLAPNSDEVPIESRSRLRRPRLLPLRDVVITGVGAILANCDNRETLWQQLRTGSCQLRVEPDPATQAPCAMGRVVDFDCGKYLPSVPARLYASYGRDQQMYLASVARASEDAGLKLDGTDTRHIGLYDGTSRGSFAYWYEVLRAGSPLTSRELIRGMPGQAVGLTAALLGIKGPTFTFNGTCAAGLIAIGHAFRELQTGRIEVALATGHDSALIEPIYQMYRNANLVSNEASDPSRAIRPYAGNSGNAFGEGAVTLVLESRDHAERRGATILAEVLSFRHGNGGQHPTDVDFSGDRPAELIQEVLREATAQPQQVDFVLGHGNGVLASDISELNYMKRVFGRRTRQIPLISTKPIYGHTFGASSALNVAAGALMLQHDYVIPTVGIDERRVVHGFHHQANIGSPQALQHGLVVAYGIGGQNAALLLKKEGT